MTKCSACGHSHASERHAFICIGCGCPERPGSTPSNPPEGGIEGVDEAEVEAFLQALGKPSRPRGPVVYPATVEAAMKGGPTPPLEDFVAAYEMDDNVVWRLEHGHINNLLEEAIDRLGLRSEP